MSAPIWTNDGTTTTPRTIAEQYEGSRPCGLTTQNPDQPGHWHTCRRPRQHHGRHISITWATPAHADYDPTDSRRTALAAWPGTHPPTEQDL
jgi:hypothetical protein